MPQPSSEFWIPIESKRFPSDFCGLKVELLHHTGKGAKFVVAPDQPNAGVEFYSSLSLVTSQNPYKTTS